MSRPTRALPNGEQRSKFRQRMQAIGRWGEFTALRDRLRNDEGLEDAEAWDRAVLTMDAPRKQADNESDPEHWPKHGTSKDEVISWVAENLGRNDLTKRDAPSAAAWHMYLDYNGDKQSRQSFWNSVWLKGWKPKAPEGRQGREHGTTPQLELIARIKKSFVKSEEPPRGEATVGT